MRYPVCTPVLWVSIGPSNTTLSLLLVRIFCDSWESIHEPDVSKQFCADFPHAFHSSDDPGPGAPATRGRSKIARSQFPAYRAGSLALVRRHSSVNSLHRSAQIRGAFLG